MDRLMRMFEVLVRKEGGSIEMKAVTFCAVATYFFCGGA